MPDESYRMIELVRVPKPSTERVRVSWFQGELEVGFQSPSAEDLGSA